MKWGHLIKKIIYSSWFLAALPAILILLLIPPLDSKFRLEIKEGLKNNGQFIYADLNGDSISELVVSGKTIPYYYITIRNTDLLIHDQWNITDSLTPNISELIFGNFDHDKFSEIYVFSYKGDSLFLNVNEILQPNGTKIDRIFITRIAYSKGMVAATLKPAGFFDTDGDGFDELYFSITSYYQLGTRRLYYFDLDRKSLNSSQQVGSICLDPKMVDIDGDYRPEIFGTFSASGNYNRDVAYSDSSTWLMVFDDRLNFKFPPVEFPGFANALYTFPYRTGNFNGYVLCHLANGTDTTVMKSRIMIYSGDGKLITYQLLDKFVNPAKNQVFVIKSAPSDRIYLLADKFFELNDRLEPIRTVDLPFDTKLYSFQEDINADGIDEFLIYSAVDKKLAIYNADLHKLTEQVFSTADAAWKFCTYYSADHQYRLFLTSGNDGYFLRLKRNNFYITGKLLYPGIYFSLFCFIVLIKRIGTSQQKAKEDLNNRLITLQLQGIKAQLDPHFTFNTLNSIASLIYLEDRQAAYDYMRKFTELLRSMLNDADKIYRHLGDEIDFVNTYLELEKLRFGNKFNYEIAISEGVSRRELVPKLVLQTFAENAVKHGIMPAESGGLIRISVERIKDYLKMTVEDNGIGRSQSAGHSDSTGKGLKLTSEFYEILNHINRKPIKHQITDLYDGSHQPSGTRVEVWVPVEEYINHTY